MSDLFDEWQDICQSRHQGSEESVVAFETKIKPSLSQSRAKVLAAIKAAGQDGITCKELAASWGVGMNKISGRFSDLKRAGLIAPAGPARDGSKPLQKPKPNQTKPMNQLDIIKTLPTKFFCFHVDSGRRKVVIISSGADYPGEIILDWDTYGQSVIDHPKSEPTPYGALMLHRRDV